MKTMMRNICNIIILSCVLFSCSQSSNNTKTPIAKESKTMHQLVEELMELNKYQIQAFMKLYMEDFTMFMDRELIYKVIDGEYLLSVKKREKSGKEYSYIIYLSDVGTEDTIRVPISFVD